MITQKVIGSIIHRYPTDGHSPYLVLDENFEKIVLKPQNSSLDTVSIQKEFLCSLLLKYWKIKTPKIYLCSIHLDLMKRLIHTDNRFLWSKSYFGSEFIENQFELNQVFRFKGKVQWRNIENLTAIIHIALFDIWVENDDRKPTNNNVLLKISEDVLQFYAIDHAFTFASLHFQGLSPEQVSFSDNDSILYTDTGKSVVRALNINKLWIKGLRDYYYLCIGLIMRDIDAIFDTLPEEFVIDMLSRKALKRYLFSKKRVDEVFNTLLYIINDIRK